jgi:PIN domain nuclease of toxin-antitoxin system
MIMLDTHTLVWWANGDESQLSIVAQKAISAHTGDGEIAISSISAWEIAMLVERGRLALSMSVDQWLETLGKISQIRFIPVDNRIAVASTQLPGDFHRDPADRMIVATSRGLSAPLITADQKIREYPHVKSIW